MKKAFAAVLVASAGISGAVAAAAASPTVVTGSATAVTKTSADLHGTVDPNGSSTTYYFQWGLSSAYGVNGSPLSAGSGNKPVPVHETAGDLIPGTVYHYRLVATSRYGTTVGTDRTFRTAGPPPATASTGPANTINRTGANLTGSVDTAGAPTTWWFQWGTSTSYSEETLPQSLAASTSPQEVTASLQGLLASGMIFHYRLVASHAGGVTSYGTDETFMTYPWPAPRARVRAATRPRRARRRPYVLTTLGTITAPASIPSTYACAGDVTIRFFDGRREVAFTLAGVQPNCTFTAQTVFRRLPGRGRHRPPAHLRIVVRYVSTPYLATGRAPYEHVTLG